MQWVLEASARTPNQSAGPTLTVLGPIVAPNISWSRNLDRFDELRFGCVASRLVSDIKVRLRDSLFLNPIEVRLYEGQPSDATLRFAGPVVGYQDQGGSLSFYCSDVGWYTTKMAVHADVTFTTEDRADIAAGLVDQWQVLDYGDYGIDTSTVTATGEVETRTYVAAERSFVSDRLSDLDCDVWFTAGREMHTALTRGSDLSTGVGAVILDGRNIKDQSTSVSIAQSGSDAYGIGTGDTPITSLQHDATAREAFGRSAVMETFDGVTQQATLDAHAVRLRDRHNRQWFQPGAGLRPVADVDVDSFEPGDTVLYQFDAGLGSHSGAYRVASVQVDIDSQATEQMAVAFL